MSTNEYIPPFSVNEEVTNLTIHIAEQVGHLGAHLQQAPTPQLRKQNRIRTIQSSLAIENNTMSVEQVTAIMDGKRVLGPPNEIQEVRNAIDAYNLLFELDPFKQADLLRAHKLMMEGLVPENGRYRSGGVGVFGEKGIVHLAPPAWRVPDLMSDLFHWAKKSKVHPLISSCVFHYEFEFIHPFADGNGRMGRLWQTLLLMRWNTIFAWMPVETIVKEHQQEYYDAIAQSDRTGNSTPFIIFMLECLSKALDEMKDTQQVSTPESTPESTPKTPLTGTPKQIVALMRSNPAITLTELGERLQLNRRGIAKHVQNLQERGLVRRVGPNKGGHWEVVGK